MNRQDPKFAERVAKYRVEHNCGLIEAKAACEKEDLLKEIEDLEYYEASRPVKEILKKLTKLAYGDHS